MTNLMKTAGLVIMVAVLFGCGQPNKINYNEIPVETVEVDKTALLRKIDRKYSDSEAHYALGMLYYADGLYSKAESEFHIALRFDPAHRKAQVAIIRTLLAMGEEDRAEVSAENYMNQASVSAASSLLLGKAFQQAEFDEYAVACYQQALGLAPNSAALHRQIGYYHLSKGDRVRAEEYLRRSFQLDPTQAEVAGELGRLGIRAQRPRKIEKDTKGLDKILKQDE